MPLRLRIDRVAASAPPSAPSTPTTRMSAPRGWAVRPWLVGQARTVPSKQSGISVGWIATKRSVPATTSIRNIAALSRMLRKLRSWACSRSSCS